MSEIHWIACETVWALRDYQLRRDVHAGGALRTRQPIAADAQILQVSPDKQRAPGYEHQSTSVKCKLEDDHDQQHEQIGQAGAIARAGPSRGRVVRRTCVSGLRPGLLVS